MICIKTGMASEEAIARTYAPKGAIVLSGVQTIDNFDKALPTQCKGIISFGLCGGLVDRALIGQAFIYDAIKTPTADVALRCDTAWRKALFGLTDYDEGRCWSSGEFNTANTVAERAALYATTGCEIIDDESFAVAEFAILRGIPFIGLRVVSDGAEDNLPPAVLDAISSNGTLNLWSVLESVITDPQQIPALIKSAGEYEKSLAELRTAAISLGGDWGLA